MKTNIHIVRNRSEVDDASTKPTTIGDGDDADG